MCTKINQATWMQNIQHRTSLKSKFKITNIQNLIINHQEFRFIITKHIFHKNLVRVYIVFQNQRK